MADERFDLRKFLHGLNPLEPVGWAKATVLTLRSALILGAITLVIFGYGYWKGYKSRPIQVDMADATVILKNGEGKTHELRAKDGKLYFDGQPVKTKDIKQLAPYGIGLKPKLVGGVTSAGNEAVGLGVEVAHLQKLNLDLLALVPFVGAGVSYDIEIEKPISIHNTQIGIGYGRDFEEGENGVIAYVGISF